MEFNQYNLYAMYASGKNDMPKTDEVDAFVKSVRVIEDYDDIKNAIIEKFGNFKGEKWVDYPNLQKRLYLLIENDRIEVCAIKNDNQYFGQGWKLIEQED